MSYYQANPQIGQLDVLFHAFDYLESYMKMGRIGYDLMGLNVDLSMFNDNADWTEFYG